MIAYYVHHQGSGHVRRAAAIAAATRTPVVGLSSRPRPDGWAGEWVELPDDAGGAVEDVTAGGVLHWAPRRHPGLRMRMRAVSEVVARARLVVVDVSVEVSLLARLHGVPVVVLAQPGERTDRAHRLAYDLADRLLAPWPERPSDGWPAAWTAKTVHLGALSRFDGHPVPPPGDPRRVLVLWGSGGLDVSAADLAAAAAATPDRHWVVAGPPGSAGPPNLTWLGWVDDVWAELSGAGVVVTHAGQNALAEVAAARRPAVVVPQRRPHGEQEATGRALARAGVAVTAWPDPAQWPALLDRAGDGSAWTGWSTGDGAARAAAVLDELAS
ncbi:hypothetical protein GCM10017691_10420 [Pseudonocardia petroleophila]|uniref:Glycosyl transferase n=1 Tax=Pseudonocardia petroleophila TaxID=37331 RepID=A0A7G7MJ24_9PSEU|nr:glycosyltransferase [Pseudonocardia petroleophila]QNG52785.1 glycosyl transferase [Pseudonocardia petroleophila]